MSNSELIDYIRLSPNFNFRNGIPIKKITIHHAAGVVTAEGLGEVFSSAERQGSSNYGIGYDGRIGLYVEEQNRAWTSSNAENDYQAVTIEVSNCERGGAWRVSDLVLDKLIQLCADICRRNNINKLIFTGDTSGSLTMHRYFASTDCPGDYLASKFSYIADEVNKILEGSEPMTKEEKQAFESLKQSVEKQNKKIKELDEQVGVKWAYIDGNLPSWATPTIKKLRNKGYLKGNDENSFELSRLMLRLLVILDRSGTFNN